VFFPPSGDVLHPGQQLPPHPPLDNIAPRITEPLKLLHHIKMDLTLDQEKLPRNRKKPFTEKTGNKTFRRATEEDPSPRMDRCKTVS